LAWTTVSTTPKIGQVVQATTTTTTTSSSGTYADVTGMTATITPTLSTSKVLVTMEFDVNISGSTAFTVVSGYFQMLRGATAIGREGGPLFLINTLAGQQMTQYTRRSITFLDSPATTSATTYKLQIKLLGGSLVEANAIGTGVVTLQEVLV
jgi:predicted solute-binding protein